MRHKEARLEGVKRVAILRELERLRSLQAKACHAGVEMDRGRQLRSPAPAIGGPLRHLFEASENRPNAKLTIIGGAFGKKPIENVDRCISGRGTKRFGFGGSGHKKGAASFLRKGRATLFHAKAVGIAFTTAAVSAPWAKVRSLP